MMTGPSLSPKQDGKAQKPGYFIVVDGFRSSRNLNTSRRTRTAVMADASDLRRRMAEQRAQIQRRVASARERASTFNADLLSARSIADQTVSHRAQLNGLKVQLRKFEADLAQVLAIQTSKRSNSKLIGESISNTTATNEQLKSLVMEHKAKRDEYKNIISNQLEAIESLEAESAAQADKNLDDAIMWYNKFLGLRVVAGEGVKFIFNKIDLKSPDKEYMFCIKFAKEKYSLLQCVPLVEGLKELVNDLNCDNDLFKFVRIMREKFHSATILGVLPASSFCPDTLSITSSSLSALSLDSRSTANQRQTQSGMENQEAPTKKGLSAQSAIPPDTMRSSKLRSLRILERH